MTSSTQKKNFSSVNERTLGFILEAARIEKGLTRAELAQETGINPSSIAKYEKAGRTEEGQYPKADKLALLIRALRLKPADIFVACLPPRLQEAGRIQVSSDYNPTFEYMERQYVALLRDSQIYRALFRALFGGKPQIPSREYDHLLWLIGAARAIYRKQEEFEKSMLESGFFEPLAREYPHHTHASGDTIGGTYHDTRTHDQLSPSEIAKLLGWEYADPEEPDWDHIERQMAVTLASKKLEKNPEEDLPSPPGSDPKPTPVSKTEKGNGQRSK